MQSKLFDVEIKVKIKPKKCSQCQKYIKIFKRLDRDMKALEYVLDARNQKRKRNDAAVKKAWGYAFAMKGLIYDALDYYQPTLLVFHYDGNYKKVNPTWTKRAKKIYEVCKAAEKINAKIA